VDPRAADNGASPLDGADSLTAAGIENH